MVVTRRTPVVPPQSSASSSSSNRTQRPPRAPFVKDPSTVSNNAVASSSLSGSPNGNKHHNAGLDDHSVKKSKKSRKRGKNKHQKSNFQAFLDFLTKLLLLAFTIYTFSICPQDTHLQSPICRGLTEYKRIILDPYIIPPVQAILAHPSVAPHIERAKPYVYRAVEITTPVLLRAQQQWNLHVVPQWEERIIPEWNKRVIPQWNQYVVPQWDKHVAPHIQRAQSKLEPYRLRARKNVQDYKQRIAPHVQAAIYNLQRWQIQTEPYVLLAASKTRDGYQAVKPYAVPLATKLGHVLQQFALFLREQRQQFVDPHVAKIWEKVKELSRGRQVAYEATPERGSSDTLFTALETRMETTVLSPLSPTSAYDAVPTSQLTDVAHIPSSLSTSETIEVASDPTFVEPTFSQSLKSNPGPAKPTQLNSAESFLVADPTCFGTSCHEELVARSSMSSLKASPATDEPTKSQLLVTSSKIPVPAASATIPPEKSHADEEIDFDAFYAELGLEEPLGSTVGLSGYHSVPPSPPVETEEERVERLRLKAEETARKRADIETRQAKWEAELQTQMERSSSQLQNHLNDLRSVAASELASSTEIRTSIEELVREAEKFLKGAEIYLRNLKGENRKPDEKLALWDRVADRVNAKFNERFSTTEGIVNAWYRIVLDKELQEVSTVTADVREIAEKAQLDLGLDYAWLEDVTFNDWQRYHALVGASEQYADEATSIQNGTHPKIIAINPMLPILEDLESEIRDVVIGFETRLRRIKRDGERAFNSQGNGVAQKEEEKGTATEPESETLPDVSILPVPRDDGREEQEFIPPVVIGRSQEEVLEALGKVGPVGEAKRAESGTNIDPEEAVSRLALEVEGGSEAHHTEL